MIIFQTVLFACLCRHLVREFFLLELISSRGRKVLEILLLVYFLLVFLCFKNFYLSLICFLFPLILLLILLVILKNQEEKNLLFQLFSLLGPLESQMKLGFSFINAWQKILEDLKPKKLKNKIQKITENLKFQNNFHYPDKEIENFIKDLMQIHQSSQPLKRLQHLQRKVKVEFSFQTKSRRVLLQIRIQSLVLSVFYFGLLSWTIFAYGTKYIHLIIISFLLFHIGLVWILKSGKKIKWSV